MSDPEELSLLAEVERLGTQNPFSPFAMVMTSGSRYDVGEGDVVAVGRSVVLLVPARGGEHLLRQSQISEVTVPGGPSST